MKHSPEISMLPAPAARLCNADRNARLRAFSRINKESGFPSANENPDVEVFCRVIAALLSRVRNAAAVRVPPNCVHETLHDPHLLRPVDRCGHLAVRDHLVPHARPSDANRPRNQADLRGMHCFANCVVVASATVWKSHRPKSAPLPPGGASLTPLVDWEPPIHAQRDSQAGHVHGSGGGVPAEARWEFVLVAFADATGPSAAHLRRSRHRNHHHLRRSPTDDRLRRRWNHRNHPPRGDGRPAQPHLQLPPRRISDRDGVCDVNGDRFLPPRFRSHRPLQVPIRRPHAPVAPGVRIRSRHPDHHHRRPPGPVPVRHSHRQDARLSLHFRPICDGGGASGVFRRPKQPARLWLQVVVRQVQRLAPADGAETQAR